MPVYRSSRPGVWRIVVWSKGRPRETTCRGTKAEAERREALLRLEDARPESLREAPTLAAFCEAVYEPHAKLHLRDSTWRQVQVYQVATLCEHLGDLPLTDLYGKAIDAYKEERLEDGLKPTSVNNELRLLGTIMRYAIAERYPCAEPKWKKLPRHADPRVRVWTTEQVIALYTKAREVAPDLLQLLVWLVNTGCRKGEAIACEWSWIDERRDMLCIPSNEWWKPKNGLPREVPLSGPLRDVLAAQRGKHARWIFPAAGHDGRRTRFPHEQFWKARDGAGLTGGVHTTRHTFASHFLWRVPDLSLLARVLGHSTTRVTELYEHLLPGHLDRARGAVALAPPGETMGEHGHEKREA